jgi:autophagy-related protein 13
MGGYNDTDEGSGDSGVMTGPSKDSVKKLDQIIQVWLIRNCSRTQAKTPQNFYTKSAIVVLQSRMSLPIVISRDGSKKVNKWVSTISVGLTCL